MPTLGFAYLLSKAPQFDSLSFTLRHHCVCTEAKLEGARQAFLNSRVNGKASHER